MIKTSTHLLLSIQMLLLTLLVVSISSCSSSQSSDKYLKYPIPMKEIQELAYTPQKSTFSVWAPTADEVRLMLYEKGEGGHPERMISMEMDEETGVWSTTLNEDLLGHFYTFNAKIDEVWQGDTPGVFAKAVGVNGKRAAVIDFSRTNPVGWNQDKPIPMGSATDMVLYELHMRSFTVAPCSGVEQPLRGKYLGLAADTTFNQNPAIKTGLAHLKELGITHVKLMPVFDFNGKDEKENGEDSYTWGYDPLNYTVPEGLYSTDPSDPYVRIKEFKELVQALHQEGIGVVMDMSYAYSNPAMSNFQKTTPGYYFAQDKDNQFIFASNGKAQAALHRPFIIQYIKESLAYWVREYHIDGFNLDLIHLYNSDVLLEIKEYLASIHPSIFLMGDTGSDQDVLDPVKRVNIPILMNPYCYTLRSNPNDSIGASFLLGNLSLANSFKAGMIGWLPHDSLVVDSIPENWQQFNTEPAQAINFIASHSGITFGDYLDAHTSSMYYNNEKVRLSKLGYTALLTAQGVPLLSEGEEFFRSKNKQYQSEKCGDDVNQIDWGLKVKHLEHFNYIKGLIQLRKNHPAFRLGTSALIEQHIDFLPMDQPQLVGYRIKGNANGDDWEDIIVLFNTGKDAQRVPIPEGQYVVVCRDGFINEQGLSYAYGQAYVTGQSAMILYRTDKAVYIPQPKPTERKEATIEEEKDMEASVNLKPAKIVPSISVNVPQKIKIE